MFLVVYAPVVGGGREGGERAAGWATAAGLATEGNQASIEAALRMPRAGGEGESQQRQEPRGLGLGLARCWCGTGWGGGAGQGGVYRLRWRT